jgi:hypothetical protein
MNKDTIVYLPSDANDEISEQIYIQGEWRWVKPLTVEALLKDYVGSTDLEFAKWLEENTTVIKEEKITLYRYHGNDGWGNYILDDIYTVYKEMDGDFVASTSNTDEAPVATLGSSVGNSIQQ